MFGFVFPKNFDSPYPAKSITEFWQRWHMSLSQWLRDYLYIPLGGNRKGPGRTYVNLMMVMLLGGLWHGAAWNFVVWGAIHGFMLSFERLQGKESFYRHLHPPIRMALTFLILLITWVFFRADSLQAAFAYLGCMFGVVQIDAGAALIGGLIYQPIYVMCVAAAAMLAWGAPQTWNWTRRITPAKAVTCLVLLAISLVLVVTRSYSPFIYFIF